MKSSFAIIAASALLASASPMAKRAMETDWVYEVVTVTVTGGEAEPTPEPTAAAIFVEKPAETTKAPAPAPEPKKPSVVKVSVAAPASKEPETKPAPAPVAAKPKTQPAKAQPVAAAPVDGSYESVALHHHNIHRANHSVSALEWDSTLAQYAHNSASSCVFGHDMDQGGGGYGQNIASYGATGDISGMKNEAAAKGMTGGWYDDEMANWSKYGQDNLPPGASLSNTGHFSQMVWKSTTKVGCATVQCKAGTVLGYPSWYTVCNYDPAGNFGGKYGANVLAPLGAEMVTV